MKNNEYSIQVNSGKIITETDIVNSLNIISSICHCFNSCVEECPFSDSHGSCKVIELSPCNWNINEQCRVYKAFNF
jgi:hypothetical protein